MIHRATKLVISIILLVWIAGSLLTAEGQVEKTVDKWIKDSILRISQKVTELSREHDDPFYVPRVLVGPIVTAAPERGEFYESQLGLLIQNSIYLKITAGLTPVDMRVVDADALPRAVNLSGLGSIARLNAADIVSSYAQDRAMRRCVHHLLRVADMVVLGQLTIKGTKALTTFRILRMKGDQVYLDRSPIHFQVLPDIPDVSVDIGEDGLRRMMRFALHTDDEVDDLVKKFVRRFAETWTEGDFEKIMSYYGRNATAVTMMVSRNATVRLTNVLNRRAIKHFWVTSANRYRDVKFDFAEPEIYDAKWNSRNVVSFSVGFFADIELTENRTRRLPLLSLYVQLRREGIRGWRIHFQRIKEVPKYSMKALGKW